MKGKDNIEESFSDRFDSSSIRNEGWNEPSDAIWEKIDKRIFVKKKRRWGIIPFVFGVLLLLLGLLSIHLFQENRELKNALTKTSVTLKTPNSKENFLDESESSKYLLQKGEPNNVLLKKRNSSNTDETINNKKDYQSRVFKESISTDQSNALMSITEWGENASKRESLIDVENNVDDQLKPLGNEEREMLIIAAIENKISALSTNSKIYLTKKVDIFRKEDIRSSRISFLPQIGVNMLSTIGSQETELSELIDKEYGNVGFGMDIIVSNPVSNTFDITYGLGIEQMNFSTEYDITLPYSVDEEIVEGDHGYIDFEHSLPTAFGNTDTALRLSRVRNSTNLTEPNVELDFNTNHNFLALSLPIGMKYTIGKGKVNFNFGVSSRPTFVLKGNSSIKSVFSHHSEIDAINNISQSVYSGINKFNLSVGIDLGVHLLLTSKSGITLNLGYQDYVFDFYKVNDFSSSLRKVGLSIGYTYVL